MSSSTPSPVQPDSPPPVGAPAATTDGGAGEPELIVMFAPDAAVQATAAGLVSPTARADRLAPVQAVLDAHRATVRPLFGLTEERLQAQHERLTPSTRTVAADADGNAEGAPDPGTAAAVAGLAAYHRVYAPASDLQQIADELLAQDLVDAAYVKPAGSPPVLTIGHTMHRQTLLPITAEPPSMTPDFTSRQGYLDAAPAGVDARLAWTVPGGGGARVRIIDCEWAWRYTHEDLLANQGGVIAGTASTDVAFRNHGTAVLGEISGDRNAFGVTGITPDAVISSSSFADQSVATAVKAAADKLSAGDVMLLEIHAPGPNAPNPAQGQRGFIAIEWWPDNLAAIRYAVAKGIVVVEAAGNGSEDLDAAIYDQPQSGFPASWRNPFNPANPSSGAVIVGAGAPPPGTHGHDDGPDRSRLDFSNWGSRIDAQGWGSEVTSTGYGDLQGGSNEDLWYTDGFNGTSSASPIVTGTVAAVQGVLAARGRRRLTSPEMRQLLRGCGSPQQATTNRPTSQRIGSRPNLRLLMRAAARYAARAGDFTGDGCADVLISSPWGIGVLRQAGATMTAPMMAPNGTRFGGWLLNTGDNLLGPVADFDGDGRCEAFVSSPWGVGVWKLAGATMTAPMMAPNGIRFGGWLLNTGDNSFGPAADYDGDGKTELIVTSPWGLGIWKLVGSTMTAPMMAPNGTRFGGWLLNTADNEFGPIGDFDGDGRTEVMVVSPWGIGMLRQNGAGMDVLMMAPNGTRFGGWLLNTADNRFGPVGDFDGDGRTEVMVTSPWGVGVLKLDGGTLTAPMMAPNGTRFGGWLLNTADNQLGPARDFDGDGRTEVVVTSPWGAGIWKLAGSAMTAPMMAPNGTRFGGWLLNTADNQLGTGADFDGDRRAEILVTSPWGVGILELIGNTLAAPMMAPNGTRFGGWLLNTTDNDFGHGV